MATKATRDVFSVWRVDGDDRHLNGRYPTEEAAQKAVEVVKRWHGRDHSIGEPDPKLAAKVKCEIEHEVIEDPDE